jgi:hypothetical protein
VKWIFSFLLLLGSRVAFADEETAAGPTQAEPKQGSLREKFIDPQDGKLDASAFLATAYGFVPIASIITDPAIGYGGALGLVFIKPNHDSNTGEMLRPDMALAAGMATENGTWGAAVGHSGNWQNGRLKTLAGGMYASLNLEFFGTGAINPADTPLKYNLQAWGGLTEADWQISSQPLWLGLRYVFADVTTSFDIGNNIPGIDPIDYDQRMSGLTPLITWDTRNNIFTPTKGTYGQASVAIFSEALGGDRDFELASLTGIWYHPLADELTLGVKGDVSASFGHTPFYLRPYVQLRGIQSLRLQGDDMAELELELRWQHWGRHSLLAFAGTGAVWTDRDESNNSRSTVTGGIGYRYLLARLFGLHMGLDLAFGPDDPIIYFQFGSAWFRP